MKVLLFFTIFSFTIQGLAQNYNPLPLDALRAYNDTNEHTWEVSLKGLDTRDYARNGDFTEIKFDSFSHYQVLPYKLPYQNILYLTGNSVVGNTAKLDSDSTILYFVNDTNKLVIQDSMMLKHNAMLNEKWVFYQNDSMTVHAEVTDIRNSSTALAADSIKTIRLSIVSKYKADTAYYDLALGKRYGLYRTIDFDALRHYPEIPAFGFQLTLLPYYELSEAEFYTIAPHTVVHSSFSTGDQYDRNEYLEQWNYLQRGADTVLVYDIYTTSYTSNPTLHYGNHMDKDL